MPIKKIDLSKYVKPSDYFSFPDGDTEIVLLNGGGLAKMHGMRTTRGFVNLGVCSEDDKCPQCLKGIEAKNKWIWVIYSPKLDVVRIIEAGVMLGNQICTIAQQKEIGLEKSLWKVTKTGKSLDTKYTAEHIGIYKIPDDKEDQLDNAKKFLIKKHYS